MAIYATTDDVQARIARDLTADELAVLPAMLEDAGVILDAIAPNATPDAKLTVSCRMVIRALGDGSSTGIPMGATQGSQTALGYSQSWTIGSGGSAGEIYVSKLERQMLGLGNAIGSYSPAQELVARPLEDLLCKA